MKNRRLFWRIVEQIESMISGGDFPPGSRLPPERELAEIFDVSRPTVREAIIALEVRERVEVKTGSGVYVLEQPEQLLQSKKLSAFELTQARALIEGEVAALAATSINNEELETLRETLVRMERDENVQEADELFHHTIAKATRNSAMQESVQNLWKLRTSNPNIIADYASVCGQSSAQTITEHREIFNALEAKDANAARAAMHKHFNRLINSLFDAIETRALEEVRRKNSEKRGLYSLDNLVKDRL
ncbi:FadR/GntR family transcriptional regulator [Echinimonas agarilytica]|uniref:FadR family transcriptional regulator n=1 Tax=Echinimonas agarilytica TaxID=1215918 RepID=A0AA41W487_9GAMM|nr:FadR/GntR family transcriptional regulator [Echinimonas agarilytica]MCM2678559.1 FadR family transcriptional regulator [Echinimonas agarilytica]